MQFLTNLLGIMIFCMSLYNNANAGGEYPDDLKVSIQNLGSETCTLSKSALTKGTLYESQFPKELPPDAEKYYFTLTGLPVTELDLTYNCGTYKKITLRMTQFWKRKHIHTSIDASGINAVDVFEKHESTVTYHDSPGGYPSMAGHAHPGRLSWQISH